MKNSVFIFVGLILLGTGVLVYYLFGRDSTIITVNGVRDNSAATRTIVQYSVGGFLAGLGLLITIGGIRGRSSAIAEQKRIAHIIQTGVAVQGTVTFVDRNYYILVNKRPIYSIVEYTYQDKSGNSHSRRVENIPSDSVIRNKIEVGSIVSVKYATEDAAQSTILL